MNHRHWARFVLSVCLCLGASLPAQVPDQEVVDFDDSEPATLEFIVETPEPFFYRGLVWEGFTVIQRDHQSLLRFPASGYVKPAVSGSFAVIAAGRTVEASVVRRHGGGPFVFLGAFLIAGWRSGLEVRLEGWVDGTVVHSEQITADTAQTIDVRENWQIDELRITASGGQDGSRCEQYHCYPGPEVILDDFRFSLALEEKAPITSGLIPTPSSQSLGTETPNTMPAATQSEAAKPPPDPILPGPAIAPSAAPPGMESAPTENQGSDEMSARCRRDPYFGVQLGAFREEVRALGVREKVAKSYSPVQLHKGVIEGQPIYRVIVGCGEQRAEARVLLKSLTQSGTKGYVVEARAGEIGAAY